MMQPDFVSLLRRAKYDTYKHLQQAGCPPGM